jgi:hypothetical protein
MSIPASAKVIKALCRPEILVRALLKKFSVGSFDLRLVFEAFERPWYALGIHEAARLAVSLKLPSVSVLEFGVAQGDGLAAMEQIAAEVRHLLPVQIEIYGFDTGSGLPGNTDYRDLPCVWQRGFYKMDVEAVRRRLPTARLILGDVAQTVPQFLSAGGFPPIGFVSFDLDYYSSTRDALTIFDGPDTTCLPRVVTYFDDILSWPQQYFCEDVGELLALREFNATGKAHRIRPIYGWKQNLLLNPQWADAMWAYHRFDHARYNDYIGEPK